MKRFDGCNCRLWDFADHRIQSVVLKVTEQCNLACDYCYRRGMIRSSKRMPFSTIVRVLKSYIEWIDGCADEDLTAYLIWHGGEPLLCGVDYYRGIIDLEEGYAKEGYKIRNVFQSNGTLIDEGWIDLFGRMNALVGISLDGPKKVQDLHRRYLNGVSSYDATMQGVRRLARSRIPYSAISVVSNATVAYLNDILDFFVDEGFETVDFIPSFNRDDTSTLDGASYANSMITLYDYWKDKYPDSIDIRFLGDIEGKLSNRISSIGCELAGCCGENLSVHVSGDVYPCECVSTFPDYRIGNINSTTFATILDSPMFERWKIDVNDISHECIDECSLFDICRGGCFNRRHCGNAVAPYKDPYCASRRAIISHVMQRHGAANRSG